ncbi:unnamed protein product [Eruca vesicaria subsp. sativa]|uniref:Uncharacterized protein n=1 Tax=Eruca vesicaria subsp. sativa TaxID=29727 RepID=A0ABC8J3P8_ERUVS|nr:unnamed protein product [Eruca vesicaria subsp. sativa]
MDLWLIAATAATGYVTKHLQNVSKSKESFPEDLNCVKPESPRCLLSRLTREKKPHEDNFGDRINGEGLECGNAFGGGEIAAGSDEEICSGSFGNRAFLRRKQRYGKLVKPFSTEGGVMSRLHREEYMLSPFPSPCGSFSRPLVVTDCTKVISKSSGDCISQGAQNCGIRQLRKLEASGLYAKRRVGNASGRSDNVIGSKDAALLLCVGISIGIISSFVANQTEVNKVKEELKQTENLVNDSEDELKKKDSLAVNDDLHDGEKTAENSESISEIEAELVAELERLQMNMNSSNIETQPADVFEMEPEFEVEFAQGELRDDEVERQRFDESDSNQEPLGNATPESGNYSISPRELSLRLHKVINSRCEERIKELEIALQESQRKVEQLVMEAEEKKKPLSRLCESHAVKRDSIRKHNPVEVQPLVMKLAGPALDAFNDSYEELMDINDSSEEGDLPYETERREELSLTSKSSPWSYKDYVKDSSRTSEDVNFFSLQDLLGLSDEEDRESENEMEKQLIKQIVEKTKQGSSAVFSAQQMLSLMEEIEHTL